MLDPQTIAQVFTLAEIDAQIVILMASYNNAIKNRLYQLDDMHSRQRVEQHDIDLMSSELNAWLKAKAIISGASYTQLLTMAYTGNHA